VHSQDQILTRQAFEKENGMPITLRRPETEKIYREVIAQRLAEGISGCRLCMIESASRFPHYTYWRAVENQFPYDLVAERSWILVAANCVANWNDLPPAAWDEYHQIRRTAVNYGVNFFLWSTPLSQSVPGHYHEHMSQLAYFFRYSCNMCS
jgi:hypothetical protein